MAPAAWLMAGCTSSGDDMLKTVALPSEQSVDATVADSLGLVASAGRLEADQPNVTPAQRGYLDGLLAVGVHPTNDLRALSIGAYVCQARAAGQSDQAVWDAVAPMVRGDVATADTSTAGMDATIGQYIAIAQQRLC